MGHKLDYWHNLYRKSFSVNNEKCNIDTTQIKPLKNTF